MRYSNYTTYQQRQGRSVRKLVAVSVAVFALIVADILTQGAVRRPLIAAEQYWASAVQHATDAVMSTGIFASRYSLAQENTQLKEQIASYRSLALSASALQEQNAELAKMAHLSQVRPGITAAVASGESTIGTFLIAAGSREGVAVGDIVRADSGYVVGTVEAVQQTNALCRTVFAPGTTLDSQIANTAVVLEGRGGGNARGKALRDVDIEEGDTVTVPSLRGYPVATVGRVEADSADAFQEVYVRTPEDVSTLRYVYVERP